MDNIILEICVKEFFKTDDGRKMAEEVMEKYYLNKEN